MENIERKIVDTKEILKVLGISETTLIRLKNKGKIPYIKIGGTHRYDVDRVIEELSVKKVKTS